MRKKFMILMPFIFLLAIISLSMFKIMDLTRCQGDVGSTCTTTPVSPVFCIYSIAYNFCVILPLIVTFILSCINIKKTNKIIGILTILFAAIPAVVIPIIGYQLAFHTWAYIVLIILSILLLVLVTFSFVISLALPKGKASRIK